MSMKPASIAYVTVGGLLVFSGIKGSTISDTIKAVLQGNLTVENTEPLSNANATVVTAGAIQGSVTGSAIATDALQYQGHAYLYGGAPGPTGMNPWDCSSFVSYILGHDMHLSIPGGLWATITANGSQHGPTTTDYLAWSQASTIPLASAQAGDLAVWSTHIGICLNSSQMISALNPNLTTAVTGIVDGGPQGETVTCRRLNAVASSITPILPNYMRQSFG
jgi:cell wall-associated NlpC family hydrolase